MHSAEQLKELQSISSLSIKQMESICDKLNNYIDAQNNDVTRSSKYRLENCQKERERVLPALSSELKIIRDTAKETDGQKKFWESKPLLLSLQNFSDLPSNNAQIRMMYNSELKQINPPLLGMTLDNARDEGNLALIYQCWLVGCSRTDEANFSESVNLSLSGIEIPDQAESLAAISQCWSNVSYAELMASTAIAGKSDPLRRLNVGREQQVTSKLIKAATILS